MRAAELLGADGPLSRALSGYELRDSQLRMAQMVEDALEREGVALIEAGTGTGKTLAYLVPAIRSGRKVVISTGTRTLQDQIMEHDLPLLERHLGEPVRAACMKGLANYVCRRRYRELIDGPTSIEDRSIARRLPMLIDWVSKTRTGDRAELDELAEDDPIWAAVESGSDTRIGPRCVHYDDCFVTQMRRRAEEAQLVVVNHHLFFADLATRGAHGGIIPDYDAVIFDEAHRIEDVATLFFGVAVSAHRVETLARDLDRALAAHGLHGDDRVLASARNKSEAFFGALMNGAEGRADLPRDLFSGTGAERYHALDAALEALELHAVANAGAADTFPQLARRASRLRTDLARVADGAGQDVRWSERRGRRHVIGASPVDVSTIFSEEVIHRVPTVVLTSATLSTSDSFTFVKQRLGIVHEVDEAILPSPFDYARQAALYLPELPDPRAAAYVDAACAEILRLVALTGGGAFVLCTSVRMMSLFAARARPSLAVPVLVQGEAPKNALLDRFRASGHAVLFATMSFWEGVDVPGDALRLVVVDKLPFDVPSDPLTSARCRRLEEAGESPFMRYLVPSAALLLKQGFGRLVRTRRDRGIVAILDSRIRSKGYGKVFLKSLPAAARAYTFEEVEKFWRPA